MCAKPLATKFIRFVMKSLIKSKYCFERLAKPSTSRKASNHVPYPVTPSPIRLSFKFKCSFYRYFQLNHKYSASKNTYFMAQYLHYNYFFFFPPLLAFSIAEPSPENLLALGPVFDVLTPCLLLRFSSNSFLDS
jgi:hypothetical protein